METIETYKPYDSQKALFMAIIILIFSPAQMVSAGESIQGTYKGTKK